MKAKRSIFILAGVILSTLLISASAMALTVKEDDNVAAYVNGHISFTSGQIYGDTYLTGAFTANNASDNLADGKIYLAPTASVNFPVASQITGDQINVQAATFPSAVPTLSVDTSSIPAYSEQDYTVGWWPARDPLTSSYKFNSITLKNNLVVDTSVLDSDIVLVTNTLDMGDSASIDIIGSHRLVLVVKNGITKSIRTTSNVTTDNFYVILENGSYTHSNSVMTGNVFINNGLLNLQYGGGLTGNLLCGGSGTMTISGGCTVNGAIYAPNADIDMLSGTHCTGFAVAKSLDISGASSLTYGDASLVLPDALFTYSGSTPMVAVPPEPAVTYTVTFDKNGGDTEASPATMTATSGSSLGSLPTAPARTGYTFAGWNTAANGSGTAFTATTAVTADITVYAQWTEEAGSYAAGLNATYYDTLDIGNSVYKRMIDQVNWPNFSYKGGSPDPLIDPETFSIVFTGYICPPESGEYTFYTYSDDGVRLTVGGTTVVDRLEDINLEFTEGTPISLTAGTHYPLKLDYFENRYASTLFLFYSKDGGDLSLVPASWYYSDTAWTKTYYNSVSRSGSGLTIKFFNEENPDFDTDTPVYTTQDYLFKEWLLASPDPAVNNDHFSFVAEGYIESRYTEDLTLQFVVDDGLRVYIDDNLLIDEWHGNSDAVYSCTFAAESSQKHKIRIEYCEYTGGAKCCMFWYSDGFSKEVVPLKYLYPVDYSG